MKKLLLAAVAVGSLLAPPASARQQEDSIITAPNNYPTPLSRLFILNPDGLNIKRLEEAVSTNVDIRGGSISGITFGANGTFSFGSSVPGSNGVLTINSPDGVLFVKAVPGKQIRFVDSSFGTYFQIDTGNGWVNTAKPLVLLPSGVWSGSSLLANAGLAMNVNWSGTYTGSTAWAASFIGVASDTVASGSHGGSALFINHVAGGSTMTGDRNALDVAINLTQTSGNGGGTALAAMRGTATGSANDGGNSLTGPGVKGAVFGANTVAHLGPSATFFSAVNSIESDVYAEAGSSVYDKIGIHIVEVVGDAVHGTRDDVAFSINNQGLPGSGSGIGWNYGIQFGRFGGHWPIASTGTLIGAATNAADPGGSMTAAYGIDWRGVIFSTQVIAALHFSLAQSGNFMTDGTVSATGFSVGVTAGVSCSGAPTGSFAVNAGIVTHC